MIFTYHCGIIYEMIRNVIKIRQDDFARWSIDECFGEDVAMPNHKIVRYVHSNNKM